MTLDRETLKHVVRRNTEDVQGKVDWGLAVSMTVVHQLGLLDR